MRESFMKTDRLLFSHWNAADSALAASLWGDKQVTAHISSSGMFTEQEVAERLALEIHNQKTHGIQYWPIFHKESERFIGCCGLRPHKGRADIFELGYHLKRSAWGNGYATEAAGAVVRYAYETLSARALFAGHSPNNMASAKVLVKLGFAFSHEELYPPTGLKHSYYYSENDKLKK